MSFILQPLYDKAADQYIILHPSYDKAANQLKCTAPKSNSAER